MWFLIHEAVAIPFWFLIGVWLDSGRSGLDRLMQAYLAGRMALAVLAIAGSAIGWKAQVLIWFGMVVYGALRAPRWLLQATRGGPFHAVRR